MKIKRLGSKKGSSKNLQQIIIILHFVGPTEHAVLTLGNVQGNIYDYGIRLGPATLHARQVPYHACTIFLALLQ